MSYTQLTQVSSAVTAATDHKPLLRPLRPVWVWRQRTWLLLCLLQASLVPRASATMDKRSHRAPVTLVLHVALAGCLDDCLCHVMSRCRLTKRKALASSLQSVNCLLIRTAVADSAHCTLVPVSRANSQKQGCHVETWAVRICSERVAWSSESSVFERK